jgi:hypothetical protein
MDFVLGEWRARKVRPIPGNPPHGRPVSRVITCPLWSICDDSCDTTRFPLLQRTYRGPRYAFSKAWRNLSVRCGFTSKTKPEPGSAAFRRSAPTQVEERVGRATPFSSSAMSSGRLFLDRVGRHQSPSPLHRHEQINTHSSLAQGKGDISTLLRRGHFYFALTDSFSPLTEATRRDTVGTSPSVRNITISGR